MSVSDPQRIAAAMERALQLASSPDAPHGPNPRVGCVILDASGNVIGEGHHRGAGTAHAETAALADARDRGFDTAGSTAVVTLEPCSHTGRTGPCAQALQEAGVQEVHFAMADPDPIGAGGAALLRAGGITVHEGLMAERAKSLNTEWACAVGRSSPFVVAKIASSLDARVTAADGTSKWITDEASRADAHRLRSQVDTILTGTGTVLADDPQLSVRLPKWHGTHPLKVALGDRLVPATARIRQGDFRQLPASDPSSALAELFATGSRIILLESGPRLLTSFLSAGLIDRLVWYVAPVLFGGGRLAIEDLGLHGLDEAFELQEWTVEDVSTLDRDIRIQLGRKES